MSLDLLASSIDPNQLLMDEKLDKASSSSLSSSSLSSS
jgi:hypothetical protein